MANPYFQFKQFTIHQDRCAMKVTTDGCLFGAFAATGYPEQQSVKVLDIGTGTGLLTLMYAQKNQNAIIDAIEIDQESFDQARENVEASPWANRISVFQGDAGKFEFAGPYDTIVSNPPFYENELKGKNSARNLALHDEGLLLHELAEIIRKNLKPGGTFFLLLPFKREEEIRKLFLDSGLAFIQLTFVRPSAKRGFFRIIIEGQIKNDKTIETMIDEISIRDDQDQYTPAFTNLLKDFYLHL